MSEGIHAWTLVDELAEFVRRKFSQMNSLKRFESQLKVGSRYWVAGSYGAACWIGSPPKKTHEASMWSWIGLRVIRRLWAHSALLSAAENLRHTE